jgi:hypothetical protein
MIRSGPSAWGLGVELSSGRKARFVAKYLTGPRTWKDWTDNNKLYNIYRSFSYISLMKPRGITWVECATRMEDEYIICKYVDSIHLAQVTF